MKQGKLVRDKIPQIIIADGKRPITRILDDEEYLKELDRKLTEEVQRIRSIVYDSRFYYDIRSIAYAMCI